MKQIKEPLVVTSNAEASVDPSLFLSMFLIKEILTLEFECNHHSHIYITHLLCHASPGELYLSFL